MNYVYAYGVIDDTNTKLVQGMSEEKRRESDDIASEAEQFYSVADMIRQTDDKDTPRDPYDENRLRKEEVGEDSPNLDTINTESAPYTNSKNVGEQEVSGSNPDPASDDDMLTDAQDVGTQLGETSEHKQPLQLGDDIDAAENSIKHH